MLRIKYKYKLKITVIIISVFTLAKCTNSKREEQNYSQFLNNGALTISFDNGSGSNEDNVKLYFKFENGQIIHYSSNVRRFDLQKDLYGTTVYDARFTNVIEKNNKFIVASPTNKGAYDSPDWHNELQIGIPNLKSFSGVNDTSLYGIISVFESSYDFEKRESVPLINRYKAKFEIRPFH